jgi:hypothetical protein
MKNSQDSETINLILPWCVFLMFLVMLGLVVGYGLFGLADATPAVNVLPGLR